LVGSELAIAVLTGHNPNVFYELGVRHAVRNNTMLLAEHEDEVPFDLRTQRLILYANRGLADARLLTRRIQEGIQQMIAEASGDPDNPVLRYLREHRTTESTVVHDTQMTAEIRQLRTMIEQLITDRTSVSTAPVPRTLRRGPGDIPATPHAALPPAKPAPRSPGSPNIPAAPPSATERYSNSVWSDMLGAWVGEASNEGRSHFYVRLVRGVPIVLYCYLGDHSATGIYYDLSRSDGRIYGRFRWLEDTDISGFAAFTIDPSDRIAGGWWYDDHVPSDVRAGTNTVALDHPGMNPIRWTRSARPVDPEWVEAWFDRAEQGGSLDVP
jgi:hypothetical protein